MVAGTAEIDDVSVKSIFRWQRGTTARGRSDHAEGRSMPRRLRPSQIQLIAMVVGASLYAAAGYFSFVAQVPGTDGVYIRPAFAILPFFGIVFGPIVGFVTGFAGNMAADQATGYGFLTAPWWHIATGMVGLVAALMVGRLRSNHLWIENRIELAAAVGVCATVIGFAMVFGEVLTAGLAFGDVLATEFLPAVVWNGLTTTIGLPLLLLAWDHRPSLRPLTAVAPDGIR